MTVAVERVAKLPHTTRVMLSEAKHLGAAYTPSRGTEILRLRAQNDTELLAFM
jgi:hypothetical protein